MILNENELKLLTIFLEIGIECFIQLIVVHIEGPDIGLMAAVVEHLVVSIDGVEFPTLNPDV